MKFSWICCQTDKDFEQYQSLTKHCLGIAYPTEYLRRARIRLCKDENGHIHGGYTYAMHGPFRVLESIPGLEGEKLRNRFSNKNTIEFTGLWLSEEARRRGVSAFLWLNVWKDALILQKKYYVFAYSIDKPAIGKTYARLGAQSLFRGETLLQDGMSHPELESIEFTTRYKILFSLLADPSFLLSRMRVSSKAPFGEFTKLLRMNRL